MAKKVKSKSIRNKPMSKSAPKEGCMDLRHGLYFLLLVFLGALGFAAIIQGILMQWSFGFKYGFFSYLLAFIFMGSAKYIQWKLYKDMAHCR